MIKMKKTPKRLNEWFNAAIIYELEKQKRLVKKLEKILIKELQTENTWRDSWKN